LTSWSPTLRSGACWHLKTKDLAVARTPAELANELNETFQIGGARPSALDRHMKRVQWLRDHVNEVLSWLGLDSGRRWKVEGLLVTDTELMSAHLRRTPIPVVSFTTLRRRLKGM
jgi:hypothetical protein